MDILRQIVASPRARHPEAGLDLCYVTEKIIATSGPSGTYPQVAYRNPLKDLVKFLDAKHGDNWAIWEFRAEGTGYPDEEVYGRVRHYPWPDHHPPPFGMVPLIVASMRNWLKDEEKGEDRVAVVHCKAGKGRSGTVSCSYLMSEEGWGREDAMKRFTERRMRQGFGDGVSIPSQKRYLTYVERWIQGGRKYAERAVEIMEVHVWGLRDGVKVAVEGYVDEGKVIKTFHTFQKSEREVVKGKINKGSGFADAAMELMGKKQAGKPVKGDAGNRVEEAEKVSDGKVVDEQPSGEVIFRPAEKIVVPGSDVNMDFERRNNSKYGGFAMVTSVAHVWFNTFFEGNGPEKDGKPDDSGVFEIDFDAMDGIKGSARKGTRAFDKMAVVWRTPDVERNSEVIINEPVTGEGVDQIQAADWRGGTGRESQDFEKRLGLREAKPDSASISRASSQHTNNNKDGAGTVKDDLNSVQSLGPDGKALQTALTSDMKLGVVEPRKSAEAPNL